MEDQCPERRWKIKEGRHRDNLPVLILVAFQNVDNWWRMRAVPDGLDVASHWANAV